VAEPESSPGSGERIGAYRIVELLGRGGMGEVFLAWDDRLKRRVAIKRIRRDRDLQPSSRQRLLREARAVAGLSHPAVVQVFDLIEDASGDCLILEYVEGRTLAAALADGPLEILQALRLARESASGLAAAHAAGIVHRDLKPENVIVTPSGHAKVLDFGLARMRARATDEVLLTQQGVILGTYHTMSPEQAVGDEADERSDLFSFGVVLYEMLTGRSPFRGATAMETLRRVISEHPPRVDFLRPGIPPQIAALVERLLAKAPDDRPASAAEVEEELEAIVSPTASHPTASVSDLPTVVEVRPDAVSRPLSRPPQTPASTAGMSVLSRRRFFREIAVAMVLAVLAGGGYLLLHQRPEESKTPTAPVLPASPARPLRVVVPKPQVEGGDERLALAASGVLTASLNALGSLEGVAAVDPLQLVGSPKSAADMARVAAADEILAVSLEKAGEMGRITLRRIHGADGRVLWTDSFDAAIEARDLRLLADAVGIRLRRGYPGYRPKAGTLNLDVSDDDYAAFLEIKRSVESGSVPPQTHLVRLEKVIERSPRFLEARLLSADILMTLFQSTKEIALRKRALALVQEAGELAPEDPRPLQKRFRIELDGDQPRVAASTLAQLEEILAGEPQILVFRAQLAEREGRTEEALAGLRTAAERVPSWQNLNRLAELEARTGHIVEARRHWKKILENSPDNLWALDSLARTELTLGDPKRAERIYQDLISRAPQRTFFINLGISRILQGKHEEAIPVFHQALAIDPDNAIANLNLAETELVLGRRAEAEAHFRKVLRKIEENGPAVEFSPGDSMTKAQCLAHLGQSREAVEITQRTLRQSPDDPEILQYAAAVYASVGDRASALVSIQGALERGVQARWFSLPTFASLQNDPEFRDLLRKASGTRR
jgi:eukaryotic-like serine/threonine-protein kinase